MNHFENYLLVDSGFKKTDNPSYKVYEYSYRFNDSSYFSVSRSKIDNIQISFDSLLKNRSLEIKEIFPNSNFIHQEIRKINNQEVVYFKYSSSLFYNIHLLTVKDGFIYTFNFNNVLPSARRDSSMDQIVNSIEFSKIGM